MTMPDITYLAAFLKNSSGLIVSGEKSYLIDSRLNPVAQKHGCSGVADLIGRLKNLPGEELKRDVVEAMTTNETSFFRDSKPFDALKAFVLPQLTKARVSAKRIRILCAAASSGQDKAPSRGVET